MINVTTRKNIMVHGAEWEYPFFMVPTSRLKEVRALLDAEEIAHHVDTHSISLNGEPFHISVSLDHPPDAGRVQIILDSLD